MGHTNFFVGDTPADPRQSEELCKTIAADGDTLWVSRETALHGHVRGQQHAPVDQVFPKAHTNASSFGLGATQLCLDDLMAFMASA
jgi:hypothetical protein